MKPPAEPIAFGAADVLQSHPVATLVIDPQGIIIDANQAAESLFNRARAGLAGKPAAEVVRWQDIDGFGSQLLDHSTPVWAYSVDLLMESGGSQCADLALGPVSATGWRILSVHPVPRGGRMPFRKPGSAARTATAAAAMLAHEIKNPLSGIRGAAQLLGKGSTAGAGALSRLICGEVDRIAGLIDSMQGFTRDRELARTSINIYPAIAQARGVAAQGFAAGTRIVDDFDPSLPRVLGSHDALVQILINLIKNACEATHGNPDATVKLCTAYRHGLSWDAADGRGSQPLPVEISVADNGPGVPEHLIDALFDPFVSSKKDGQGLGLALVDKLVRDMGGIIQLDRDRGWTRFRIHLPVAPPNQETNA